MYAEMPEESKKRLKQVNSNKALAGKVLQSLFTAGVVYVCIFGGGQRGLGARL